jgi:hypothetical protein
MKRVPITSVTKSCTRHKAAVAAQTHVSAGTSIGVGHTGSDIFAVRAVLIGSTAGGPAKPSVCTSGELTGSVIDLEIARVHRTRRGVEYKQARDGRPTCTASVIFAGRRHRRMHMRCSRLSFFASQRGGSLLFWGSLASNSFLNCKIGKAGNQRPHAPQPRNMHDNESYRRERDFSVKPPPP